MRYGYKNNYYSCFFLTNTQNVRLYYPYWQYTNLFIFQFVLIPIYSIGR